MSVRSSLGIVAATRIVVFLLSLTTVVVVSRLLTPEEIGIFSVTVALVAFGHVFRDFGVGQYLMQVREVTRSNRRAAFTVTLSFSWCIAAALFFGRDLAAGFYKSDGVPEVLALLAINFVTLPFGAPLRTLLQREMQFGKLATVNIANQVVQAGTTMAAALAGASYLSMAWGSIAGNITNVIVLIAISPSRAIDWPTRHGLGEVLRFGSKSSVAALATETGSAAPDLILGRTLGFADVAFYSRAKGLISMALEQMLFVVRTVYTPVLARGFREGRDLAELYCQTVTLLLGLTLPLISLIAILSPNLVIFMFGAQWQRSAPLASIICAYALITAPFTLAMVSLAVSGHIGAMMRSRLIVETTRISILLMSIWHSLEIVVLMLGIASAVEAVTYTRALRMSIGLQAAQLWSSVRTSYALIPFTVLLPGIFLAVTGHLGPWPPILVLVLGSILGLVGWLCGLIIIRHPLLPELRTTTASILRKLRP